MPSGYLYLNTKLISFFKPRVVPAVGGTNLIIFPEASQTQKLNKQIQRDYYFSIGSKFSNLSSLYTAAQCTVVQNEPEVVTLEKLK